MSKNLDSMLCETEEYKKAKHKEVKTKPMKLEEKPAKK